MKRPLLFIAAAALSLSVNAQMQLNPSEIKDVKKVVLAGDVNKNTTRAAVVGNMYYYRPQGMFYSGWNKNLYNPYIALAPANTTLTFKAANIEGTPVWSYPSGKLDQYGAAEMLEAEGPSVDIKLPKGTFPAPYLSNADNMDKDFFFATDEMEVGGGTYEQTLEGKCMDVCAVNYVPEGKVYTSSFYFNTNDEEADKHLAELYKLDKIHTKGFGELFVSPVSMTVEGFGVLVVADAAIEEQTESIIPAIMQYDDENGFTEIKGRDDFDVELTSVYGAGNFYHLHYTLKGDAIEVPAGKKIMPVVNTEDLKMTPMYDGQLRWDQKANEELGVTTMFVNVDTPEGQKYTQFPGFGVDDGTGIIRFINSWCISLDMSYENSDVDACISDVLSIEQKGDDCVYTLSGLKVAENGKLDNLPNGAYIMNGKKFIVK